MWLIWMLRSRRPRTRWRPREWRSNGTQPNLTIKMTTSRRCLWHRSSTERARSLTWSWCRRNQKSIPSRLDGSRYQSMRNWRRLNQRRAEDSVGSTHSSIPARSPILWNHSRCSRWNGDSWRGRRASRFKNRRRSGEKAHTVAIRDQDREDISFNDYNCVILSS